MRNTAALATALTLAACGGTLPGTLPPDAGADAAAVADAPTDIGVAFDVVAAQDVVTQEAGASRDFAEVPLRSEQPVRMFTEAESVLDASLDYRAVLSTDAGRITIDLHEQEAPIAVNSFVFLALHRYFDGLAFHRVIEGFVAQGGDPLTAGDNRARWGTGGPGYTFTTETRDSLRFDGAGVLGMARSMSRESNGSQFFITLAATANLNGQYTVFGRVTEGLDVLPMIARNASANVPPTTPTRMTTVRIEARPRGG